MTPACGVTIEAPAKINLGIEILGKRPDGFHEIRSVILMLELVDSLRLTTGVDETGHTLPGIPPGDNLVTAAIDAFRAAVPGSPKMGWAIEKRIPVAAGLGGASSDAAAALLAANALTGSPLSRTALIELAATLGSDIPFFLGASAALVSGRGTDLDPLPAIDAPVTLLLPKASIFRKTQTLYSMLTREDLSAGDRIERGRLSIVDGHLPPQESLANAFSRPLALLVPDSRSLLDILATGGADRFGVSGAGPAHYVIGKESCETIDQALATDQRLKEFDVIRTRTRTAPLAPALSGVDA